MYKLRRKQLSQNFLYSRKLIEQLVGRSSISQNDIVIDIGAGKGILTSILTQHACHVIAIELDHKLVLHLHNYFDSQPNVSIIEGNILDLNITELVSRVWNNCHPEAKGDRIFGPTVDKDAIRKFIPIKSGLQHDRKRELSSVNRQRTTQAPLAYKVFANIPFAIEGQIVRQLLDTDNPPIDTYLVVRRDLAERLSGIHRSCQFSICHQPWFEFSIVHHFRRADFTPAPQVDSVLWRIRRRAESPIPWANHLEFESIISAVFANGQPIGKGLSRICGKPYAAKLLQQLRVPTATKPSHLSIEIRIKLHRLLSASDLSPN